MFAEIIRTLLIFAVLLVAGILADEGNEAYVWFIALAGIMTIVELKGKK